MPICNQFFNPYNDKKLHLNRLKSAQARHERHYYGRRGIVNYPTSGKGDAADHFSSDLNKTTAFSMTGGSGAFLGKDARSRNETALE